MADLRDPIIRRVQDLAIRAGEDPQEAAELAAFGNHPRWRMDTRFIEFQCGCVAQRFRKLTHVEQFEPIIFKGLPEQAVYDRPCKAHEAGLNDYVKFGHYVDFEQWRNSRLQNITGE